MSQNILTGLVGAWCPSLGPSGYTLLDRSGRGNHGSILRADSSIWKPVADQWALQTDGATNTNADYVSLPASAGFSDDYSLSWWLTIINTNTYGILLYRATSGQALAPLVYVGNGSGGSGVLLFASTTSSITRGTALTSGQLFHVAITRQGGVVRIYQNGRQQGSDATQAVTFTGTVSNNWLLAQQSGGENTPIQLYSFGMWQRALTPSEVYAEYQSGPKWLANTITQRRRNYALKAARNRTYLFLNRPQIIGGGTL